MIFNFKEYLTEGKKEKLQYYIYDWDDNILHMSTIIHMQKYIDGEWVDTDVSTIQFANVRLLSNWRLKNDNPVEAYSEFGDFGERGNKAFIEDMKYAISNSKFGPMWINFINCLINGNLFMIVTSRNHNPESIRSAIEWIIYNYLDDAEQNTMITNLMGFHDMFDVNIDYVIDEYLDKCEFWAVGNPLNDFIKTTDIKSTDKIEIRKAKAIKNFKNKLLKYGTYAKMDLKIGYSEDDKSIISNVANLFSSEKQLDFMAYKNKKQKSRIEYSIDDTSNPKNINKIRI